MLKWFLLGGFLLVICVALAAYQTGRSAYESAPYTVVKQDGPFELRDYPALALVETAMNRSPGSDGTGGEGGDNSFRQLFRYITGSNERQQTIAMTTPVYMNYGDTNAAMAFVMPKEMTLSDVPQPTDTALSVRERAAGTFAVIRFKGSRSQAGEDQAFQQLEHYVDEEGLISVGSAIFAYFDPPWVPGFLRRNEVMIRIQKN